MPSYSPTGIQDKFASSISTILSRNLGFDQTVLSYDQLQIIHANLTYKILSIKAYLVLLEITFFKIEKTYKNQ